MLVKGCSEFAKTRELGISVNLVRVIPIAVIMTEVLRVSDIRILLITAKA